MENSSYTAEIYNFSTTESMINSTLNSFYNASDFDRYLHTLPPEKLHAMSLAIKIVCIIILSISLIFGLFGNTIVCIAVKSSKTLQNSMNALLVNLAIADLCNCVFCIPMILAVISSRDGTAMARRELCLVTDFFQAYGGTVQLATLAFISFERYQAIADPFGKQKRLKRVKIGIGLCWMLGLLAGILAGCVMSDSPLTLRCTGSVYSIDTYYDAYGRYVLIPTGFTSLVFIVIFYLKIIILVKKHVESTETILNRKHKVHPAPTSAVIPISPPASQFQQPETNTHTTNYSPQKDNDTNNSRNGDGIVAKALQENQNLKLLFLPQDNVKKGLVFNSLHVPSKVEEKDLDKTHAKGMLSSNTRPHSNGLAMPSQTTSKTDGCNVRILPPTLKLEPPLSPKVPIAVGIDVQNEARISGDAQVVANTSPLAVDSSTALPSTSHDDTSIKKGDKAYPDEKTDSSKIHLGNNEETTIKIYSIEGTVVSASATNEIAGSVCVINQKSRERGRRKMEARTAKRSAGVIGSFLLCWLLFPIVVILRQHLQKVDSIQKMNDIQMVAITLATMTTALNPIVYGLVNKQFRTEYMKIMRNCGKKCVSETS